MNEDIPEVISRLISGVSGLKCWHVGTGGAVGPTFSLAIGAQVPRMRKLKNPSISNDIRHFEGQIGLFVWCAWRLDNCDGPVTSWDDNEDSILRNLTRLVGASITSFVVTLPVWDLSVSFDNGLFLHVLCDQNPNDSSFDGNWDLRTPDLSIAFGPGTKYRIEKRPKSVNGIEEKETSKGRVRNEGATHPQH